MMEHFEFALGQQVLAYSQGLLYEAKVIDRRVTNSGCNQYYIHYKGFKAKWDEWLDEEELLEVNAINLGHKRRLLESRRKLEKTKTAYERRTAVASSSKSATRRRVLENEVMPIVADDEVLVIDDEPITAIENEVVPVFGNRAAVRPGRGIIFHNIPPPMLLANELRSLKLPRFLKGARDIDRTMHKSFGMVLKFPEKNFVAEVLHEFTKSNFFVDDDVQKKYTIIFPVTLMKYFNTSVHSCLTYKNEKKHRLQNKGMSYFRQRMIDRPNINYVLKNYLNPRRIWCYLYGPIYLLRLLVHLPKILVTNSWHPEYDTNMFVLHIKQLMRFLEHNYDTYFSVYDYIPMDHNTRKTKNVFLRQASARWH
ncbi:chromatin modification-related protein EAF3-like isoform X2 [Myzus persicae]|uniref:chromatin modification-related protein EAF3-like isoform X2 n=1 Tax=Myzus persicae TaxID=13164 RepID=UPI000B935A14|nr:chromatin modification-related protein EAF3-like isoform X2 [Myzus persicae]